MSLIKIQYSISGTTALAVEPYVVQAATNPAVITAGEQLNLDFIADGTYFTLVPVRNQVKISNATIVSWTCKTPFVNGTLVINNVIDPTLDVEITIPVKVKVAPQLITKPFLSQNTAPIDTRLVLSKKEMLETNDLYQPDVYFALCKDDGHFYLYNKNGVPTEETGKYTLITDIIEYSINSLDGGLIEADEIEEI